MPQDTYHILLCTTGGTGDSIGYRGSGSFGFWVFTLTDSHSHPCRSAFLVDKSAWVAASLLSAVVGLSGVRHTQGHVLVQESPAVGI